MRGSILAVDDNPANLDLLFDLLDEAGYHVLVAKDGESAITRAQKTLPDLILLDVMMPGIDGFETCRQLKTHQVTQHIPVIFMTALKETTEKVRGFELGAVDYITKPIQAEEVLARVTIHLKIQRLQRDLTEKNQELSAALDREKELSALKSRFISMASHELRNPLTILQLSLDLLKRYHTRMSSEKQAQELESMGHTLKHMQNLLDEVLMASKAEAGRFEYKPRRIDASELCQRVFQRFQRMSEHTHTLRFSHENDDFHLSADPELLEHIFSNLLSNAIKYSPAGGNVVFELIREPETILCRVHDEGIGISEADQQHLFDAFHRGKNVGDIKGTGLGLSIVKEFVKLHHGTISVESEVNQGTTFTVVFPCDQESGISIQFPDS